MEGASVRSGVLLVFYSRRLRFRWLLGALVALTLASLFRFQAGICVPVLVAAPIVLRRRRDLIPLAAAGAFLFACTGWLDFLMRDSFHASLRAYLSHNIDAGTDYGVSAWYNYILLLLGASLPPLLFSRFRNFPWRDYRELWPVIAMTSLFVLAHSAVPHKEDRFMVPIFPLYLALLAPLAAHLFARRPKSWRSFAFVLINATLIALLVGTPSQNNAIAMVRFLGERPSIRYLWALAGSLKVYPVAYSEREPAKLHRLSLLPLRAAQTLGCETAIVVPEDAIGTHRPRARWIRGSGRILPGNPRETANRNQSQPQRAAWPAASISSRRMPGLVTRRLQFRARRQALEP